MSSITNWTRLEPAPHDDNIAEGLQARIKDPLWLLARQWQMGEFEGEDGGSPVSVRLRVLASRLARYHPQRLGAGNRVSGVAYDPRLLPLEALVERETAYLATDPLPNTRLAAEMGQFFLRLLAREGMAFYHAAYNEAFPIREPSAGAQDMLDAQSERFVRFIAGRAPDGVTLFQALDAALRPSGGGQGSLPAEPGILAPDVGAVTRAARQWLAWADTFILQPPADEGSAWSSPHMEYSFALAASTGDGEVVLSAEEYGAGHLDWYAFDHVPGASLGIGDSDPEPATLLEAVIPAPVSYKGMPADRWWEFEDAQVNLGRLDTAPDELLRLLLAEFSIIYGNDWFVAPLELPVGSIYRIGSLIVTDTFGERVLIPHYSAVDAPRADWRMYSTSADRLSDGQENPLDELFFLAPALAKSLQGEPVEEVALLRDEQANLAWAVERTVMGSSGKPANRFEAYQEGRRRAEALAAAGQDGQEAEDGQPGDRFRYRLATAVPDYWLPLLPVPIVPDEPAVRLQRGKIILDGGNEPVIPSALGRILEPGKPLSLFEEEVPRAGVRITRAYQLARWLGGSTYLWIGRQKSAGAREGFSGLRFDQIRQE